MMRVVALLFVLAASTAAAQPAPADPPASESPASESPASGSPATESPTSEPAVPVTELFVPPSVPAEPAPQPEPLIRTCFPAYAEGHLLVGGSTGPASIYKLPESAITRWSVGLRLCTRSFDVQAGLVFDEGVNTDNGYSPYRGTGGEARALFRLPQLRIGPHIAVLDSRVANASYVAIWVGARVEKGPAVLGIDVMRIPGGGVQLYDVWGVYGSLGLRGSWPQVIGLAAISAIWIGNLVLNEHSS